MKMKICCDLCFIDIGVAIATYDAITFFTCLCISRYQELLELLPPLVASIMAKFKHIL